MMGIHPEAEKHLNNITLQSSVNVCLMLFLRKMFVYDTFNMNGSILRLSVFFSHEIFYNHQEKENLTVLFKLLFTCFPLCFTFPPKSLLFDSVNDSGELKYKCE